MIESKDFDSRLGLAKSTIASIISQVFGFDIYNSFRIFL